MCVGTPHSDDWYWPQRSCSGCTRLGLPRFRLPRSCICMLLRLFGSRSAICEDSCSREKERETTIKETEGVREGRGGQGGTLRKRERVLHLSLSLSFQRLWLRPPAITLCFRWWCFFFLSLSLWWWWLSLPHSPVVVVGFGVLLATVCVCSGHGPTCTKFSGPTPGMTPGVGTTGTQRPGDGVQKMPQSAAKTPVTQHCQVRWTRK